MTKKASVLLTGGALALVVSASSVSGQSPETNPLIGTWRGSITIPAGELPMVIRVAPDPSAANHVVVTMESPLQTSRLLPLDPATVTNGTHLAAGTGPMRLEVDAAADGTLIGQWIQTLRYPLTLVRGQEPRSTPYRSENVVYANSAAGFDLAGTLTLPQGPGPFPAVVLVSGSGPQDRDGTVLGHKTFLILADHLTREGIAVLRADDRGVGASRGSAASATSQDFAGDVRAAVAYLRTRPEIRKDAIGLAGLSEGGLIAPIVAADDPQIAFVVMMAGPGVPGAEVLYLQGEAILRANGLPQKLIDWNRGVQSRIITVLKATPDTAAARMQLELALPPVFEELSAADLAMLGFATLPNNEAQRVFIDQQISTFNNAWLRYLLTYDPRPTLRRVKAPVLALGGSLDTQVPAAANLGEIRKALSESGNRDVTVTELPRLNHLFQTAVTGSPSEYGRITETFAPVALETISRWILERTKGR